MILDTPSGRRRWGDLNIGDAVFTVDGITTITQLKRYRHILMYRVTLDDGSYCDVSSGHLWTVKGRNERRRDKPWITLSTQDVLEKGVKRKNGKTMARQWELPPINPVFYKRKTVPIHPYVMGIWLGDGVKGSPRYQKPYPEIAQKIESFGYETSVEKSGATWICGINKHLKKDVFRCNSPERYIPDEYKYNSAENRKQLLMGLLDTDGEISKGNCIGYSTTSKRLAEDVVWLVRSLGGKAKIQNTVKQGWYYKAGKKKICRICYRITITLPFNPFTVKHRKERYKVPQKRYLTRWIDSITPIGNKEAMCITVDRWPLPG